jgi:hypothetical protein
LYLPLWFFWYLHCSVFAEGQLVSGMYCGMWLTSLLNRGWGCGRTLHEEKKLYVYLCI